MDNQNRKQSELIEAEKRLLSELQAGKKSGEENGWKVAKKSESISGQQKSSMFHFVRFGEAERTN